MNTKPLRAHDNRDMSLMERYREATIESLREEIRRLQTELVNLKLQFEEKN